MKCIWWTHKLFVSLDTGVLHWGIYGLKQGNPLQNFKITHNYLIFNLLSIFINYLIISMSTELIFDSFKIFWSKGWGSLGKIVCHWGSYSLKQGNTFQSFKITHNCLILLFNYHFLINYLIISRSTELIHHSFKVLWGKR